MWLRQSTASQEISIGPFLDSTDGDTEEDGLTIANTDIKLRKGGTTTLANKNSGGATNISNGVYHATLDATDSNTLGLLEVYVHVSGALATKSTYMVLPAATYDALVVDGLFNFDPATDAVANVTLTASVSGNVDGSVASVTADVGITQAAADKSWATTTRELTSAAKITSDGSAISMTSAGVIASVTTVTTLSAAGIKAIWDQLTSALTTVGSIGKLIVDNVNATISSRSTQTSVDDVPTNSEFNARTILSGDYFDPAADDVATVTLVEVTNVNSDMLKASEVTADMDANSTQLTAIVLDTGTTLPDQITALNDITVSDILTTQMTEAYAADGVAPTLAEAVFLTMQNLQDFGFTGTTQTVRRLDGTTTAATYTLDDGTTPTDKTRTT